jgi:hypothetical protein
MQKIFYKFFWDGKNFDEMSGETKLKRIVEYADLPHLIHYPFSEFKEYIFSLKIDRLWTDDIRKNFLKAILPYVKTSNSWDELLEQFIKNQKLPH